MIQAKASTVKSRSVEYDVKNRVIPRTIGTGVMRGQQTIVNEDGSKIVLGLVPNTTEFGISFFDASGNIIFKQIGTTTYVYDPDTNTNVMQIGELPDGTYGMAVAKTGVDLSEAFS